MQKPKHQSDKPKRTRPPVDWGGLSNEPRNENLGRMKGPTSFETNENDRDKQSGPSLLYRFKKDKSRGTRGKKG